MRVKSSSPSSTPASRAMAIRCSTAFVDPPRAITTVMAFSKASRVMISSGLISFSSRFMTAAAARRQSSFLCSETASWAELFARLIPSASMAEAIVFAVYMPPQAPGPGMAVCSTSSKSASLILPPECAPTASKTETMSRRFAPGRIVPPYTNTAGRFSRAMAITQAGMFLSHPPIATRPSKPSAAVTASIESAMISRDTSE